MDKDKSILEKITDTVKDIANIATDAADYALKQDQPGPEADREPVAAYVPLAADGPVVDPMMVPPMAATPARKRKRGAPKRTVRARKQPNKKSSVKKVAGKSPGKTARTSAASGSNTGAKKTTTRTGGNTAKKAHRRGRGKA